MRTDEDYKLRIFALLLLIALFLILLSAPLAEKMPLVKVNALPQATSVTATPVARAYLPNSGASPSPRPMSGKLPGLVDVGLAGLCTVGILAGAIVIFWLRKK